MFSFPGTRKTVPVIVGDKTYDLPRFGMDRFAEWAEQRREADTQRAMNEAGVSDKEQRGRWRTYFSTPTIDVGRQLYEIGSTAAGVAYVIRDCMKRADVPADQIEIVLESDPIQLGDLAQALTDAEPAAKAADAMVAEEDEASDDPLSVPSGGSDASTSTGTPSTPDSSSLMATSAT